MPNNKTAILAQLLTEQETKQLAKNLIEHKKDKQEKLLQCLIKVDHYNSEKPTIFKTVFNANYSKEKDYLIRNELRKLSQSIVVYVKDKLLKSNTHVDYFNFLLNRKGNIIFEKEISKVIAKQQLKGGDELLELQKIHFEYLIRHKPRKLETLSKIKKELLECICETPNEKSIFKSFYILLLSILERIIWQHFKHEFTDFNSLIDNSSLSKSNDAMFYFEKAKSFQLFGLDRVQQLENCIVQLQTTSTKIDLKKETAYLESQIGLEYFLLPNFEKSELHFENAYQQINLLNESQKLQLIYNYSSMLCAAEKFATVNKILNKHAAIFQSTPFEHNISLFAIMARINEKQFEELRSLLPASNEALSKDAQVYTRIFECIILYYENEYELCLSYLENIYNTSRYNKFLDKAFIDFAKLFQRYISAILIINKKDKQVKLQACLNASNEFIDAYQLGFGSNMLCSVWLNNTIKENL